MSYKTLVALAREISLPLNPSKLRVPFLTALETEDWEQLRKIKADPNAYSPSELECYRNDAQIAATLRKLDSLPTSIDVTQVAISKFLEGEKRCFRTNEYFHRVMRYPRNLSKFDLEFRERAFLARKWISKVLGPIPDFLDGRFGPGSVVEASQWNECNLFHKFIYQPTYTGNFSPELRRILVEDTAWGRAQLLVGCHAPVGRQVDASRLTTVPKNGEEERVITIGPGMNVFAQLSVGSHFKKRICKQGIRLLPGTGRRSAPYGRRFLDGQEFHRLLARDGSLTERWCTLDLRNASSHNAREAVRFLFSTWGELMDELREPCTMVPVPNQPGKSYRHRLEMYSAMGNGFTFEVLTLMMLGLAYASGYVPGVDAFAFGDDVILEQDYRVDNFIALLRAFGHELNPKKSFTSGPFRESCGGDYWLGCDVRPVEVDQVPEGPIEWMELHNHLLRKGFLNENAARIIRSQVKKEHRFFGPPEISGVFHSDRGWTFPSKQPSRKRRFNAEGMALSERYQAPVIATVVAVPRKAQLFPAAREPQIIALLGAMGLPWRDLAVRKNGRDEVGSYRVDWVSLPKFGTQHERLDPVRMRTWQEITDRIACTLLTSSM